MAFLFCNNCGHRNPANSNFCSSCGAALDVVREEQTITFHPVDPLQDAAGLDGDDRDRRLLAAGRQRLAAGGAKARARIVLVTALGALHGR